MNRSARIINISDTITSGIALIALIVIVAPACAEDWPTLLGKIKEKYASFDDKVQDVKMLQQVTARTPDGKVALTVDTETLQKDGKMRVESTTSGGLKTITLLDGKDSWGVSTNESKKKHSGSQHLWYFKQRIDWWAALPDKGRIDATELIDSRECYVVTNEDMENPWFSKLWIDKKELLMVQRMSKKENDQISVTKFSDFRRVENLCLIAFKAETSSAVRTVAVTMSIEVNKNPAEHFFDPAKMDIEKVNMLKWIFRAIVDGIRGR